MIIFFFVLALLTPPVLSVIFAFGALLLLAICGILAYSTYRFLFTAQLILQNFMIFCERPLSDSDIVSIDKQILLVFEELHRISRGYLDYPLFCKYVDGFWIFLINELDEASFAATFFLSFRDLYEYSAGRFAICRLSQEGPLIQIPLRKAIFRVINEDIMLDGEIRGILRAHIDPI